MRSGLAAIQESLTPEAASILSHAITEAGRRKHSQVTPLHVAATLLASPSSFLRQACIRSHPNSSHPLQCRALELCFSVALDRLPMTQAAAEPPISNALTAALKRAQAHQRRGSPDQQQQPLLTVKVELEQLIISILDDPSVSRVMREASFSSPAVKATIEKSMNASSPSSIQSSSPGLGFRPSHVPVSVPNRNIFLNPRLQLGQQQNAGQSHLVQQVSQFGQVRVDDVKRIVEIMSRYEKRNPVLVGDSELQPVLSQLFTKMENKELSETVLKKAEVIHLEKEMILFSHRSEMSRKIKELGDLIERRMCGIDELCSNGSGKVVLNLGDLKWLVEQQQGSGVGGWDPQPVVSEAGRLAVEEVGRLLRRFGGRLWLVGMATCETFSKCQMYHNCMEKDWDLQAVPIATNAPQLHGSFPRFGPTGIMYNSFQPVTPSRNFATSTNASLGPLHQNIYPASKISCCPQCKENYEKELADTIPLELESPTETTSEAGNQSLPAWLQSAKMTGLQLQGRDKERKQKKEELMKKWNETCFRLHPNFNHHLGSERVMKPLTPALTSFQNPKLLNPKLVAQQPFLPKLQAQRNLMDTTLQLNPTFVLNQPPIGENAVPSPPRSSVRTELILGRRETPEKTDNDAAKEFMSCISSGPQNAFIEMPANKLLSSMLDADWLKKLMKTLTGKVWWQREAASAVVTTVAQYKMGNGKQSGAGSKGNVWLLFTGPDRVGKIKMASVLSELVCGLSPVVISFGSRRSGDNTNTGFRGRTALDRIGDAIKRNPFSVIMLEDIDEADLLIRGNIKRAMESGRISDSHGRQLSLGHVTFILTSSWLPDEFRVSSKSRQNDEEKLMAAKGHWQLKLTTGHKTAKRRANWTADEDEDKCTRPRKDLIPVLVFDLNEAADTDDDRANGSGNSSDLTAEHNEDSGNLRSRNSFINPATRELLTHVDSAIVFDPVDFSSIRQRLSSAIATSFSTIIHNGMSIRVQEDALEKILGGIWQGQQTLEDWLEDVLVPSLQKLKTQLQQCHDLIEPTIVQLEVDSSSRSGQQNNQEWLPSSIRVALGQ